MALTERHTDLRAGDAPAAHAGRDIVARVDADWRGALGARPAGGEVKGRLIGNPDGGIVAVMGGISAGRFVADEAESRGWWPRIAGPGLALDLDRIAVLGFDWPLAEPGFPPILTPADQARLLALVADAAGVERLDGLVGASYGGMAALEFARQFPERAAQMAVIAAAHRPSVMGGAWRGVQRRILEFAISAGRPEEGVSLARQLAMTTYRAPQEFSVRFDPIADHHPRFGASAEVCEYLMARGEAYVGHMSAERFLALSASVDLHNVRPEEITTPALLVSTNTDWLNPPDDMRELGERLAGPAAFRLIDSPRGHDSFLVEHESVATLMREFLSGSWRA